MASYDTWLYDYLDDVGWAFYGAAGKCYAWSDAVRDHWIGKAIIFPFTEPLGDFFETGAWGVWATNDRLSNVHSFIQDMLHESLLSDLLDDMLSNWRDFKNDPVYWAFCRIVDYWPDFYWLAQDPVYMVAFWLGDLWSDVQDLFSDATYWVFSKIDQEFPDFYWLRQDPAWTLRCWLVDGWPFLDNFFQDTYTWLKYHMARMWDVPVSFWDDPWENLKERFDFNLETLIQEQRDGLYRTGEHLLRYFFEGVW